MGSGQVLLHALSVRLSALQQYFHHLFRIFLSCSIVRHDFDVLRT
jgi:hypothetical protein